MQNSYGAFSWLAVSVAGLVGFWLHLHYRRRDRMLARGAEVERLEAEVQALQADRDAIATEARDRVGQLEERLDFAERLLAQAALEPRPIPVETGRVPTPV